MNWKFWEKKLSQHRHRRKIKKVQWVRDQVEKYNLIAPEQLFTESDEILALAMNGCGTDDWKGILVPGSFWLLDISAACHVRDLGYSIGESWGDKEGYDLVFQSNLERIVNVETGWGWLRRRRMCRVALYFIVVDKLGDDAFWAGKDEP